MAHEKGSINVSVANLYKNSCYESEIITQGLLGEDVQILQNKNDFIKIRQKDGYKSWISRHQISQPVIITGKKIIVRDHFIGIFKDKELSLPLKDAVIGCCLTTVDEDENLYKIHLPTGESGWTHKKHFTAFPELSKDAIINLAKEFLGYQYFWGGKTPKGFDCSGFVQLVFALLGKQISRDAWLQVDEGLHLADTFEDAGIADLLFFGSSQDKITHVGISLGNQKFIHALGWVRINSLNKDDPDFSPEHLKTFIAANRFI